MIDLHRTLRSTSGSRVREKRRHETGLIRKGAEGWKQYQGYDIQTKVTEYPK